MTDRRLPSAAAVVLASAIAAAGMAAHNVLEFEPAFLLDPETLIPLAIFGLFALRQDVSGVAGRDCHHAVFEQVFQCGESRLHFPPQACGDQRSKRPNSPAASISILEVSLVPPAVDSKRYDASRRTGPDVVLKVILLSGS